MKDQKSKIAFIVVLYKTPKKEIGRLKKEIDDLRLKNKEVHFIDNTGTKKGYAEGVNEGIRKGLKDGADFFAVMNPDISLVHLRSVLWLEGAEHFDVWGLAMRQHAKTYYGGIIDPWKMSGGLIEARPNKRFGSLDFVSGSLIIIKKEVIEKIGFFDERYFMYYEEVDYCHRAKKAGFRVGIDSKIEYEHYETSKYNVQKEYLLAEARKKFLHKFGSIRHKVYDFVQRVLSSSFLLNFFSLNVSSLIVKLTNFVNFLFLVRYLTVPEYGIYALVWAQVTLLSPLADFGTTSYGVVNLSAEKEHKLKALINFRMLVSSIVFLSTVTLSVILFRNSPKIIVYILLTSTVIFTNLFSGSYFIINALQQKLYRSSRNSIVFNIVLVSLIGMSLILFHRLFFVFLIIFVCYNVYSIANILFIRKELASFQLTFTMKGWKEIVKKSYVFVLISFFASLYFKLDVFLLKILKGESEVGIYSAGYKFLDALLFMAASYNVTATPIFTRLTENASAFAQKIKKDFLFLLLLGLGTALSAWIFSPLILPHIFKKSYVLSIPVLQIVILALPLILLNSIWINVLYVLQRPLFVIVVFIIEASINLILNWIFIPRFSYVASSYITVISEIINFFILIIFVTYAWRKKFSSLKIL